VILYSGSDVAVTDFMSVNRCAVIDLENVCKIFNNTILECINNRKGSAALHPTSIMYSCTEIVTS